MILLCLNEDEEDNADDAIGVCVSAVLSECEDDRDDDLLLDLLLDDIQQIAFLLSKFFFFNLSHTKQ